MTPPNPPVLALAVAYDMRRLTTAQEASLPARPGAHLPNPWFKAPAPDRIAAPGESDPVNASLDSAATSRMGVKLLSYFESIYGPDWLRAEIDHHIYALLDRNNAAGGAPAPPLYVPPEVQAWQQAAPALTQHPLMVAEKLEILREALHDILPQSGYAGAMEFLQRPGLAGSDAVTGQLVAALRHTLDAAHRRNSATDLQKTADDLLGPVISGLRQQEIATLSTAQGEERSR